MLAELAELGKALKDIQGVPQTSVSSSATGKQNAQKTIVIIFVEEGGHYRYDRVIPVDYDKEHFPYFPGGSRGHDISITSHVSLKPSSKTPEPCMMTLENKTLGWLKNASREPDSPIFTDMLNSLVTDGKVNSSVASALEQVYSSVISQRGKGKFELFLSVGIERGGNLLYPGDSGMEVFNLEMERMKIKSFDEHDGYCFLCGAKGMVYGNVLPTIGLRFATTDSKTFTYGLNQGEAWKNAPLCPSCASNVEGGYDYVKKWLSIEKKFDDDIPYDMMLIPVGGFPEDIRKFCNRVQSGYNGRSTGILYAEDPLGDIASGQVESNFSQPSVNIIFYIQERRAVRIVAYVSEVTPSRLKKVYDTAKRISSEQGGNLKFLGGDSMSLVFGSKSWRAGNPFIRKDMKGKQDMSARWFVPFLSRIFSFEVKENGKDVRKLADEFFDILTEVFTEIYRQPDLVPKYLGSIKADFYEGNSGKINVYKLKEDVLENLSIDIFMSLIKGDKNMEHDLVKDVDLPEMESFFAETGLTKAEEKAALAGGVLAGKVLRAQRIERGLKNGEEPFWQEFGDINMMDHWKLREIAAKSVVKLQEYGYGKWPDVKTIEEVALKLASSKVLEDTPKNRIGFYFIVGVVLSESVVPIGHGKNNYAEGVENE